MPSASTQRTRTFVPVVDARVLERLVDGEVGVLELHVLADERDLDLAARRPMRSTSSSHSPRSGSPSGRPSFCADERVEALRRAALRHEVDVAHVLVRDHGLRVDVGEERDLLADVARERLVRAADDDVRVDTDAPQLVHRVLRRLRLQLAGGLDERDEGDVQVEDVLRARPRAGTGGSPRGTGATRCRRPCRRSRR